MERSLQILRRLDKLEKYYWEELSVGNFKASSGIESCISLRMKLFGLDGKELISASNQQQTAQPLGLSLSSLSDASLFEIETLLQKTPAHTAKTSTNNNNTPIYHDPMEEHHPLE